MATDITLFSNVPAHLRNTELSDATKALMGGGSGGKRISIKGGVFRLVSGGKELSQIEDRHLDVIIVRASPKVSRQFYIKKYEAGDTPTPPDCWSNDGEKPDASAKNRQHLTCAGCPQNIAGSGQGTSRACRYNQRLAVMLPDDLESGVYALTLPATSIFGKAEGDKRPLQDYVKYLALQTKPVNVDTLVTRMKFDTKSESPKLFFSPVRWLEDDEYGIAREGGESMEAKQAVTMTVAAIDGATAEPLKLEGARPEADMEVAEEPVVESKSTQKRKAAQRVEPENHDEPEKRKSSSKPEPVKTQPSKLADVVSQWDDE